MERRRAKDIITCPSYDGLMRRENLQLLATQCRFSDKMDVMVYAARLLAEENARKALGNEELRRYLRLEYRDGALPPTSIPRRWNSRRHKAIARLRRAVKEIVRSKVP